MSFKDKILSKAKKSDFIVINIIQGLKIVQNLVNNIEIPLNNVLKKEYSRKECLIVFINSNFNYLQN